MPETTTSPAADRNALLARFDGDVELFREIVGLFLGDCPERLSSLRDAVKRRDGDELAQTAHSIKGAVANFAAESAVAAVKRLELIGRNRDWAEVDEASAALEDEIARLSSALQSVV